MVFSACLAKQMPQSIPLPYVWHITVVTSHGYILRKDPHVDKIQVGLSENSEKK